MTREIFKVADGKLEALEDARDNILGIENEVPFENEVKESDNNKKKKVA